MTLPSFLWFSYFPITWNHAPAPSLGRSRCMWIDPIARKNHVPFPSEFPLTSHQFRERGTSPRQSSTRRQMHPGLGGVGISLDTGLLGAATAPLRSARRNYGTIGRARHASRQMGAERSSWAQQPIGSGAIPEGRSKGGGRGRGLAGSVVVAAVSPRLTEPPRCRGGRAKLRTSLEGYFVQKEQTNR